VHARAATAAVLLFLYAGLWLVLLGLAGWVGPSMGRPTPRRNPDRLGHRRRVTRRVEVGPLASILYAVFGFALGAWSAWFGMTANYGIADWIFTGIVGIVPVLIGGLALRRTA
jgi:hypothetical protein